MEIPPIIDQLVPLSVGARALGMTAAWCRQLHRRGLLRLERPGGPTGKFYIRLSELERAAGADLFSLVHTRRPRVDARVRR